MEDINLTILGDPTAQKRHRTVRMGTFNRQYDPGAGDKADFLSVIQQYAPETPLLTPLRVDFHFYFMRPKAHYNSKGVLKPTAPLWHTSKKDIDNCMKFCMDAMNKIYWKDDGQICYTISLKQYSEKPRTEIMISEV